MGKIMLYWMQRQALKRLQIQRKGRMDMTSLCGSDCCGKCPRLAECGGCQKTEGRPFGGRCVAAEWVKTGGLAHFEQEKSRLIAECNALGIQGLALADLNLLNGFYVNLEYTLPNGTAVKLLEDNKVYLGKPAASGAMALWGTKAIFWSVNTAAAGQTPRSCCIKNDRPYF